MVKRHRGFTWGCCLSDVFRFCYCQQADSFVYSAEILGIRIYLVLDTEVGLQDYFFNDGARWVILKLIPVYHDIS